MGVAKLKFARRTKTSQRKARPRHMSRTTATSGRKFRRHKMNVVSVAETRTRVVDDILTDGQIEMREMAGTDGVLERIDDARDMAVSRDPIPRPEPRTEDVDKAQAMREFIINSSRRTIGDVVLAQGEPVHSGLALPNSDTPIVMPLTRFVHAFSTNVVADPQQAAAVRLSEESWMGLTKALEDSDAFRPPEGMTNYRLLMTVCRSMLSRMTAISTQPLSESLDAERFLAHCLSEASTSITWMSMFGDAYGAEVVSFLGTDPDVMHGIAAPAEQAALREHILSYLTEWRRTDGRPMCCNAGCCVADIMPVLGGRTNEGATSSDPGSAPRRLPAYFGPGEDPARAENTTRPCWLCLLFHIELVAAVMAMLKRVPAVQINRGTAVLGVDRGGLPQDWMHIRATEGPLAALMAGNIPMFSRLRLATTTATTDRGVVPAFTFVLPDAAVNQEDFVMGAEDFRSGAVSTGPAPSTSDRL